MPCTALPYSSACLTAGTGAVVMGDSKPEAGPLVLSLLSHELRSPIGVVRGYLRMLDRDESLSASQRQAVSAALRATDRSVDLLAQASQLAQMWRRETPISRQTVPLADLLQSLPSRVTTSSDR